MSARHDFARQMFRRRASRWPITSSYSLAASSGSRPVTPRTASRRPRRRPSRIDVVAAAAARAPCTRAFRAAPDRVRSRRRASPTPSRSRSRGSSRSRRSGLVIRNTLSGLRSRWTTLLACAAPSAARNCFAMSITPPIGAPTHHDERRSGSASTSSMTMYASPFRRRQIPASPRGRGARSTLPARPRRRTAPISGSRRQDLDRDTACDRVLLPDVDVAHAAFAEARIAGSYRLPCRVARPRDVSIRERLQRVIVDVLLPAAVHRVRQQEEVLAELRERRSSGCLRTSCVSAGKSWMLSPTNISDLRARAASTAPCHWRPRRSAGSCRSCRSCRGSRRTGCRARRGWPRSARTRSPHAVRDEHDLAAELPAPAW